MAISRFGIGAADTRRKYRVIDLKRDKIGMPAAVQAIEYDPNRSARIALVRYEDGEKRYIVASHGLKVGDTIISGPGCRVEEWQLSGVCATSR